MFLFILIQTISVTSLNNNSTCIFKAEFSIFSVVGPPVSPDSLIVIFAILKLFYWFSINISVTVVYLNNTIITTRKSVFIPIKLIFQL